MKNGRYIEGEDINWYLDDQLHREDGPAVEHIHGIYMWYLCGKLHREGGPAIEWLDGDTEWWRNGHLHREDGPACENKNKENEWYLNNIKLTQEDFNQRIIINNLNKRLNNELDRKFLEKKRKI